ncbi:uncharacterized protein METZ01_LOCUS373378 [marine metagenome]|uniref:Uncharacterized protein n=1 Tax=marine metagenome TaxID=408172 RepID=A0A382TEI3_9ZZZZ
MDEGAHLLVAADVAGLREWEASLGMWAPFATLLLMVVQALAAPTPAITVFGAFLLIGFRKVTREAGAD